MNTMTNSLTDCFPALRFAGPADRFIDRCESYSISDQLKQRRIERVIKMEMIAPGELGTIEKGGFFVALNRAFLHAHMIVPLGSLIARTFHYNLTYTPPMDILDEKRIEEVQGFYREFSTAWIERNSPAKIINWLKDNVR